MSIAIADFQKIEIKVGSVNAAERVAGSEKLVRMEVDFGSSAENLADETQIVAEQQTRQIVAGIGKAYAPEELIGKKFAFVTNLEQRRIMGLESQGMILAASDAEGRPALLSPQRDVPAGSMVH